MGGGGYRKLSLRRGNIFVARGHNMTGPKPIPWNRIGATVTSPQVSVIVR